MSLTELLAHYGYAVVLVGTFLEGETILVMAGFAAHQGYAFGRGFSLLLEQARTFEEHALVALLVTGACLAAVRFLVRRGWTKPRPGNS